MAVGLFQPASNPAPNPAGFAEAAGSIFDTMQTIAGAARRQQSQQQQQNLKDAFESELKMRKNGYTPVPHDANGLARRGDIDSSRLVKDPFGRSWVAPDAKAAATPQQTFTDSTNLLEKGARPVDASGNVPQMQQVPRYQMDAQGNTTDTGMFGINAAPPAGTTVTPPGTGQAYFVPGEEEKSGLKARLDAANTAAKPGAPHIDTEHFSTPVSIDPKTGKATAIQLPDGVTHNDKQEKTSKYTFSYHTDDHGNVHVLRGDPDSGDVTEIKTIKGAGSARQDDVAARAAERKQDRADARQQSRVDAGQKQIEAFQTQEQTAHGLRSAYADAVWGPDGKELPDNSQVVDPKTGQQVVLNAARRTYYKRQFENHTAKVNELQQRQKAILKRFGGDAGDADQQQAGKSKGKLTDQKTATQYLQKAGGDKAKARQLAKADGWEF